MDKIKAVILDWGGVLIDDPLPGLMAFCSGELGVSEDLFMPAMEHHSPLFQKGLITEREFWQRICDDLQVPGPGLGSLWSEAFRAVYAPKREMIELVRSLKVRGFKTALLSNTEAPAVEYFHELDYDFFTAATFSCEEHTRKPEAEIYALTLQRLRVAPCESVFIDDRRECVEGARAVGMETILYTNPADVINALSKFFEG